MANGDRRQARAAFESAKAAAPKFLKADLSLVQLDVADGKMGDARRRLETVLASNGDNTVARLWLGNVEATTGDSKAALEQFRQVVAADPNNAQALTILLTSLPNTAASLLKR